MIRHRRLSGERSWQRSAWNLIVARIAIVMTHPVQYNAPWLKLLSAQDDVCVHVFYTWHAGDTLVRDPGFGKSIQWDIPLLDGYEWELLPPARPVERRTFWNMDSPELISRISAWQPDAVLVCGWNFASHFRVMRWFHGRIPVLFRGDSTLLDDCPGIRSFARSMLLRYVYRHIDFAIAVGSCNREYFRKNGLGESQLVTAPHAIDNQRFAGTDDQFDREAELLRREMGFGDHDVVILFAGKFERKKDPLGLVRVFQMAASERTSLRLLLVGDGVLEPELRRVIGTDERIRILPFQNQQRMPVVYRVGDIVCLPSRFNETWGLCLNEAMACGRAVMATDRVGAARDLLVEGRTGFRCPELGSDGAVDVFRSLPERRILLDEMGVQSQRFIQDWSFDGIVNAVVSAVRLSPSVFRATTDGRPT